MYVRGTQLVPCGSKTVNGGTVQDEMIEIQEKEEAQAAEEKAGAERESHAALMREANLEGTEGLLDAMVRDDPEWAKMAQVHGVAAGGFSIRH